jgi:hypothetical protein
LLFQVGRGHLIRTRACLLGSLQIGSAKSDDDCERQKDDPLHNRVVLARCHCERGHNSLHHHGIKNGKFALQSKRGNLMSGVYYLHGSLQLSLTANSQS